LLQRCLRGRHAEALIGDLLELQQEGRSRWWYWRQVLIAIVADIANTVRASGRSLIVALVVGWVAILVWRELNALFIAHSADIYRSLRASSVARPDRLLIIWSLGALLRFVSFVGIGWLVARLNTRGPAIAAIAFAASVILMPVPWQQVRAVEDDLHRLAYYGLALAGIFAGAWIASRSRRRYSMITGS
jgi:hypothetical protein